MVSETTLQRTLDAAGSLGRPEYLTSLASLIVYMDILLALFHETTVSQVSLAWLKLNVDVGGALVFLLSYAFIRSYALPLLQGIIILFVVLPVFLIATWRSEKEEVSEREFAEYSILTRNTPAYRELERQRGQGRSLNEASEAAFSLASFIGADVVVAVAGRNSLSRELADFLSILPHGALVLCVLVLTIFGIGLLLGSFVAPFLVSSAPSIIGTKLRREIYTTLGKQEKKRWHLFP